MPVQNNLAALREAAGISRPELATRMGTTPQQVERLEKGQRRLCLDWIEAAATALNVSPCAIICSDHEESPRPSEASPVMPARRRINAEAMETVLSAVLKRSADIDLPARVVRPTAEALLLSLQLIEDRPGSHSTREVIEALVHGVTARLPDARNEN